MSGYGPSVSLAVTAHEDADVPPVEDPDDVVVGLVGLVADPEQALKSPPTATPNVPSTLRRDIHSLSTVFMMRKGVARAMPALIIPAP